MRKNAGSLYLAVLLVIGCAVFLGGNPAFAGTVDLPRTGQTTCYDVVVLDRPLNVIPCEGTGQDGEIQAGVAWPDPRFTDNADGTITDNLTGLMWLKDSNCFGRKRWQEALDTVANFNVNPGNYSCKGCTAAYNDWRLPNRKELHSLTDFSQCSPALPLGHPFLNIQTDSHHSHRRWSSTTEQAGSRAWIVFMYDGFMTFELKPEYGYASDIYVWPVRGGQTGSFVNLDIKRNGASIEVRLDPGDKAGQNADWWLGVDTPAGWYCYDIYQGAWVPGFSFLVYQGPLFDLPPSELPAFSNMPAGTCTFYFGIDTTMNGRLDGNIYYDTLVVQNDSSMGDDWAPPFIGPDGDSDGSCHSLKFTPVGTTLSSNSIERSLEFGASEQITLLTTACGQPVTVSSVVNPLEGTGWLSAIPGGGSKVILELNAGASGVQAGFIITAAVKVVAGGITDNLYVQLRVEDHGTYTNSLGMTFSLIPAGTFMMGSPEYELGRYIKETQHRVTLTSSFYMQTTEVTQAQWEAVMGSNPSYFSGCGGNCPVEMVSWNDVQDFIAALNSRGEGTYRLPTEAEWEYAARAGSTTAFANGDIADVNCNDPNLDAIGWYCGNNDPYGTKPVAQKLPNAWGLYDMHGNLSEVVQDWYGSYPTTAVTDPTGPETGSYCVVRGGAWNCGARSCRSANRCNGTKGDGRNYYNGFRLLRLPQ